MLYIFVIFSFLGWIYEYIFYRIFPMQTPAAYRNKKVWQRSLIDFPFLIIYGLVAVILYAYLESARLVLGPVANVVILTCIVILCELVIGYLIFHFMNVRLWDYSKIPCNFKGYISLPHSLAWMFIVSLFYYSFPYLHNFINLISRRFKSEVQQSC